MPRKIVGTNEDVVQEYRRQRRRVQSFVRRAEKRGYSFDENIIPQIPSKVTEASVRRLAKMTPDVMYKKSTGFIMRDGEIVEASGTERRREERQRAARRGANTRWWNRYKSDYEERTGESWDETHPNTPSDFVIDEELRKKSQQLSDEEWDRFVEDEYDRRGTTPPMEIPENDFLKMAKEAQQKKLALDKAIEDALVDEAEKQIEQQEKAETEPSIYDIAEEAMRKGMEEEYGIPYDELTGDNSKWEDFYRRKVADIVDNTADVSIIEAIKVRLYSLPDETYVGKNRLIDLSERKNALIEIFEETLAEYEAENNVDEYLGYLLSNQEEIFTYIDAITYDSGDESRIEHNFIRIANLLNGRPLSVDDAKRVEYLSENDEDFGEYED